jgi:beta-ketoacyl-acyl-carrier-protein synthase II
MKRVVVTGIGVVSPIGIGKEAFWENNKNGKSGLVHLPEYDFYNYSSKVFGVVKDFDPVKSGLSPSEIRRMDRVTQFGVSCSQLAIDDANIDWNNVDKSRVGVNIANAVAGTKFMDEEFAILTDRGKTKILIEDASPYSYSKSMPNTTSNEIAYRYGVKGSCFTMATGCTAGIDSIGCSYDLIRSGDLDIAICGASEAPITPITIAAFEVIAALTYNNEPPEKGSRPFCKTRNGFALAEGAGILVLEELEVALARKAHIYGEVIGYGSVNNAFHMTGLKPDGADLARAINICIEEAGIDKTDIDYINAHGSGTKQNDISETGAYKRAFGDYAYKIPISSTKSMTGHPLGAASAIETVLLCLALENNFVPPTINYSEKDELCDLDYVPNEGRDKEINVALTNASGFSGIHSALLLKKYKGE